MTHTMRSDNELYVYINGELVYKRWHGKCPGPKKASRLFNKQWPDVNLPPSPHKEDR